MADLLAGRVSTARAGSTVADGIAVSEPGRLTSSLLADHAVEILVVPEAAIEQAIAMLLEIEKTVVEGAAALAALMTYPERFAGRRVGLVLSGGNIDPRTLSVVALRGLAVAGRLNRLRVELDDVLGRLALVADLIAREAANVVEFGHDGLGSSGARSTVLELRIDTLDAEHAERVLDAILAEGLTAELVDW
jgi:threonine dehydratase